MSNSICSSCPHFGKTSCIFTAIGGIWKCTRELQGETITVSATETCETAHMGTETECTAPDCLDCERNDECNHIGLFEEAGE